MLSEQSVETLEHGTRISFLHIVHTYQEAGSTYKAGNQFLFYVVSANAELSASEIQGGQYSQLLHLRQLSYHRLHFVNLFM